MKKDLLAPMTRPPADDRPAEFPFQWVPPCATDVRATFDRLCPGWRERKPGDTPKVALITQQPRRKQK